MDAPSAKLAIETHLVLPPKPTTCFVMVESLPIAKVSFDELRRAVARLDKLESDRKEAGRIDYQDAGYYWARWPDGYVELIKLDNDNKVWTWGSEVSQELSKYIYPTVL